MEADWGVEGSVEGLVASWMGSNWDGAHRVCFFSPTDSEERFWRDRLS